MNPSRTIPLSIGLSLFIIFLSYFGVSAVITLAVPYCLQVSLWPLVLLLLSLAILDCLEPFVLGGGDFILPHMILIIIFVTLYCIDKHLNSQLRRLRVQKTWNKY